MTKSKSAKKKQASAAMRAGAVPADILAGQVATFTSRGATSVTPPNQTGNHSYTLNVAGNPFTGTQDGLYKSFVVAINLTNYFDAASFTSYDYYRVREVETTFAFKATPSNGGPLIGELFFVADKDSREAETVKQVCNRGALQSRAFTNENHRKMVSWTPYLVENPTTEGQVGVQVDYVQPRMRWLNTSNVRDHRFGALKCVVTVPNGGEYETEPAIQVRHRVVIECKGSKSFQ